jgi:nucleotidyltransferase/DNA polymerase involved in DNA repair
MRIACIHIPQFALQCASRLDPALRGAPVVVVGGFDPTGGSEARPGHLGRSGPLHAPVVMACSRAAWALGVRLGMTASSARARSAELTIVTADAGHERETVRAIADAALSVSEVVDVGGRVGAGGAHLAMYCAVPAKTRGQTFGDRLLALLEELGLTGRIGIADDRFTAWVAAAHGTPAVHDEHGVTSVPRGGSAAFLASRPLSLLAIPSEVQHMLEALGVRTLGEFAALPAPSVHRPVEADYQALARGEGGTTLRAYVPEAPVREDIIVGGNVLDRADAVAGPAAVAMVARRVAVRLAGRGRFAARLEVTALTGEAVRAATGSEPARLATAGEAVRAAGVLGEPVRGEPVRAGGVLGEPVPIEIDTPVGEAEELARVLAPIVEGQAPATWRLRVVVAAEVVPGTDMVEIAAEGSARIDRRIADTATIDPLAVVLSTSGSLFALTAPDLRAERRDAHRRTRRGKQRRVRPASSAQPGLPKLFDRRS